MIRCRVITDHDRNTIKSAFYDCDSGHKGFLSKEDLKVAFIYLLGYKPSKVEIDGLIENNFIKSKDGDAVTGLQLEKFLSVMSEKLSSSSVDDEIRETFLAFDRKCRGFITLEDVKSAFSLVSPCITQRSIESAFREIDRDADGRITFRDFEFMMKYTNTDI